MISYKYYLSGEMVEWSKAPHWKCGVPKGTEGSNPSLSAIFFAQKNGGMKPSGFASWHAVPLHASQDALHILRHRRKMLHKKRLTMKHCSAKAPQYEAASFHSAMKHSLRSYDEKMKNESSRLQ